MQGLFCFSIPFFPFRRAVFPSYHHPVTTYLLPLYSLGNILSIPRLGCAAGPVSTLPSGNRNTSLPPSSSLSHRSLAGTGRSKPTGSGEITTTLPCSFFIQFHGRNLNTSVPPRTEITGNVLSPYSHTPSSGASAGKTGVPETRWSWSRETRLSRSSTLGTPGRKGVYTFSVHLSPTSWCFMIIPMFASRCSFLRPLSGRDQQSCSWNPAPAPKPFSMSTTLFSSGVRKLASCGRRRRVVSRYPCRRESGLR